MAIPDNTLSGCHARGAPRSRPWRSHRNARTSLHESGASQALPWKSFSVLLDLVFSPFSYGKGGTLGKMSFR